LQLKKNWQLKKFQNEKGKVTVKDKSGSRTEGTLF
jgi:hypothetical protein